MSLTEKDKEEITEIVKSIIGESQTTNGGASSIANNQPDFESWKKNGIKSKLANIIIAPEDYFEGDKRYFTWDEAIAAQDKMPDGWRLPTRQEMVLMCEEFGRQDPNGDYDDGKLIEELKLGKNGYIDCDDMEEYNENPAKFGGVYGEGTEANYWSVGSNSATNARYLGFDGNYTYPENYAYKTNGFSVRPVRDTEFPEKGAC